MSLELPGAVLEETVHPDHVVVIPQTDGTVHMLCYCGSVENGFISLKYVILDEKHVKGIADSYGDPAVPVTHVPRAPILDELDLLSPPGA